MTRARALWLAAAVALVAVGAFLLTRRSRRPAPVATGVPAPRPVTTVADVPATVRAPVAERSVDEQPSVGDAGGVAAVVADTEQPLATWIRVAIVAGALVAFFAVSLVATKQL